MSTLQTLDRGIRALERVSLKSDGISIADLAEELEIHRAICYRIVETLESHRLVARLPNGRIVLGTGLAVLSSRFAPQLRQVAEPVLQQLAARTGATAYLSTAQGDECVVTQVVEPPAATLHVGYRVGNRHPINRGAAGLAILALRPPAKGDSEAVEQTRRLGYGVTRGELEQGAVGVAAGVRLPTQLTLGGGVECSVGVVAIGDLDIALAAAAVKDAADRIGGHLRSDAHPTADITG